MTNNLQSELDRVLLDIAHDLDFTLNKHETINIVQKHIDPIPKDILIKNETKSRKKIKVSHKTPKQTDSYEIEILNMNMNDINTHIIQSIKNIFGEPKVVKFNKGIKILKNKYLYFDIDDPSVTATILHIVELI